MAQNIGSAIVKVDTDATDIARVLRIIGKHATACADELDPDGAEVKHRSAADDEVIANVLRERAERHKKLRMSE